MKRIIVPKENAKEAAIVQDVEVIGVENLKELLMYLNGEIVLEKEITDLKLKVEQRDLMLKDYQKEHEILLNNSAELRVKIVDLENNIELLTNNLSEQNKELISDFDNQN